MSYDQGYRTGLGRVVCAREDQLGPKAASYRKGSRTWDKVTIIVYTLLQPYTREQKNGISILTRLKQ